MRSLSVGTVGGAAELAPVPTGLLPGQAESPPEQACPRMFVGIITYNPDIERLGKLCDVLQGEGISLFIIDNRSDNAADISDHFATRPGVRVTLNERNLGVAAGVNQLADYALAAGVDYIMPVDQDSRFDDNYAHSMLAHFRNLQRERPQLAALGGKVFDIRKKSYQRFVRFTAPRVEKKSRASAMPYPFVDTDFLITSGTVLSVAGFEQIGPMREELFIDNVDLDWSFRAIDCGWYLAGCEAIHLYQEVGVDSIRVPLLNIKVRVHDPLRYYYMTRNRLFLYRQPYACRVWMLKDLPRALLKFAFLSVMSPMRKQIIKEHARGMFDSFKL